MKEALFYLLAISVAEVITVLIQPVWGMVCHIIVLVTVIVHSALTSRQTHRQLLLSLALVPLVRVMSLSMPLINIPQIWWYPIIYAPLLAAAIVVACFLNLRTKDMVTCPNCGQKTGSGSCQWCEYPILKDVPTGRRKLGLSFGFFPVQLVVALSGIAFGVAEYFILKVEPIVSGLIWQEVWPEALVLLVCTGFVEEFIFRGVLQYTALQAFGGWGIVYISLLFAVLHAGFLSWIDVVFVFFVALFFGWVVKKTGSLFGVTLSHGLTNIMLYMVVPFFV